MGEFYMRIEYGEVKKEIRVKYTESRNYDKCIHAFLHSKKVLGKLNTILRTMGPCATHVYVKLKCSDFHLELSEDDYMTILLSDFMFIDKLSIETMQSRHTDLVFATNVHINVINILGVDGDVNINIPSICSEGINIRNDDRYLTSKKIQISVIVENVDISDAMTHVKFFHDCYLRLFSLNVGRLTTNLSTALDECVIDWKRKENILPIKELRLTHCPLYYVPNLTRNSGGLNFIENRHGYFYGGRPGSGLYSLELKKYIESLRNAYTAFLPLFRIAPGAAMDILKSYSSMFAKKPEFLPNGTLRTPIHEIPDRDVIDCLMTEDAWGEVETPFYGLGLQDLKF